jgi:uncharacterized damage-inducible protein DinB
MDLSGHYKMLARYNRIANERLYAACGELDDAERRKQRAGSFGSIHALLNHNLLADRIWMGRFESAGHTKTPALNTVLYEDFAGLKEARAAEDARIESFFAAAGPELFGRELLYTNSMGAECVEQAAVAAAHLFNHQTHHRGQIHVMLSQTGVKPPSLDMHRIINPL